MQFDRSFFRNIPALILVLDKDLHVIEISAGWKKIFGDVYAELPGRDLAELLPECSRDRDLGRLAEQLITKGEVSNFRLTLAPKAGTSVKISMNAMTQYGPAGDFAGAVAVVVDVTESSQSHSLVLQEVERLTHELAELRDHTDRIEKNGEELVGVAEDLEFARDEAEKASVRAEESEKRFRTIVTSVADGILVVDSRGIIQLFNHAAETIFGYSVVECVGRDIFSLIGGEDTPLHNYLNDVTAQTKRFRSEVPGKCKDGSEFPMELTANGTSVGSSTLFVVICRDISDRKQAEQKLELLAKYDPLTALANRTMFHEKLEEALVAAKRRKTAVAVLYLDLDHFKDINDTLGHPAGDHLLKVVAKRLNKCVRDTDTVARLGGDEFAIIATDLSDRHVIMRLANRILEALSEPVEIESNIVHTGTSIGLTLFPDDATQAEPLLKNADLALYRAKSNGRNTFEFFHREMNDLVHARIQLENELREAVVDEKLFLHYQPQVDLTTGRIVGVEALIRWQNSAGQMVPPDKFIPVAEGCGLMRPITDWVLKTAIEQTRDWRSAGIFQGHIAINLSPGDLKDLEFLSTVKEILSRYGLAPSLLELEVTEGMMMENIDAVLENLKNLREYGVKLAIDDFGTGYSSLAYLRRFSVDRLKIDRAFITDLTTSPDDVAITGAIISMAHSLGLRVVAEGVETQEQLDILKARGCDEIQGYYVGRPMPARAFAEYVREVGSIGSDDMSSPCFPAVASFPTRKKRRVQSTIG